MSARTGAKVKGFRRVERWLVGVAFSMIAFVLERVVMRSVRRGGSSPKAPEGEARTITSRGGDVDVG